MSVSPFTDESYDLKKIRTLVPKRPEYAAELDDLLGGDMWRDGNAWGGEMPIDPLAKAAMGRSIFSENELRALTFGYAMAVTGKEPRWQLVPTDGERPAPPKDDEQATPEYTDIKAIEDAITKWWDDNNLVDVLQQAAWHLAAEGHGVLGAFVAGMDRNEQDQLVPVKTLEEALERIYIDVYKPGAAGWYTDPNTRQRAGVVLSTDADNKEMVEFTFVDADGITVLRQYRDGQITDYPYDLGGRLFIEDSACRALITPQLIQGQKAITLVLTQTIRNVNLAGNRQVDYINTDPPGEWVDAAEGTPGAEEFTTSTGSVWRVFKAAPIQQGVGVRNYLRGVEVRNDTGEVIALSTPNINVMDPVTVDHFEQTYQILQTAMYKQAYQSHVLRITDAQMSGVALSQSRAHFTLALRPLKTAMDKKGRWIIETVLALAAVLMGKPGMFSKYRSDFNHLMDSGPVSPEEQQEIRANQEAKLISRETAMSMIGIDDVGAEQAKIDAETESDSAAENRGTANSLRSIGLPTAPVMTNRAAALQQAAEHGAAQVGQQQQVATGQTQQEVINA